MERYVIRAAKYVVYLVVLFFVIFFVMDLINDKQVPFWVMFSGSRGLVFSGIVIVFALIYPFFGFVKKTLTFDASSKVEEVVNVMNTCGFATAEASTPELQKFRARSTSKKVSMMWEDEVIIETIDGLSTIRGSRREVVKAAFRFGTFIG